jgi:hypothetical protein
MTDDLKFMLAHYPSFKDDIVKAHEESDEFKSLCEDIHAMTQTLQQHDQRIFSTRTHELEYRKLLLELENELLKYFGNSKGK